MTDRTLRFEALPGEERAFKFYDDFYEAVKNLTNHAFRMDKLGIDFVNAEDLEVLLQRYNPNPTEEDEDSYDQSLREVSRESEQSSTRGNSTPDGPEDEVPEFELPDAEGEAERP